MNKFFRVFMILLFTAAVIPIAGAHADPDRAAVFYPTSAYWDESAGEWIIPIHGYVYGSGGFSLVPLVAGWIGGFYAWMEKREDLEEIEAGEIDPDDREGIADRALLKKRVQPFFLKGEGDQAMKLTLKDSTWPLDPSDQRGHIQMILEIAPPTLPPPSDSVQEFLYEVRFEEPSDVFYRGTVYLVPPSGLSVVSDVDDTIKISEVRDREELLENTLLYPFYPVAGMAAWYRQLLSCGAAFHYVSKSPWQLYRPLAAFLEEENFPGGSFHLRYQHPLGFRSLWKKAESFTKKDYIRGLMQTFPHRDFILIGDSTQQDPEIYAEIAQEFPNQVRQIFIRKVKRGDEYLTASLKVLDQLDTSLWTVFTDSKDVTFQACENARLSLSRDP